MSHSIHYAIRVRAAREVRRLSDPREVTSTFCRQYLPVGSHQAVYFGTEFCEYRLPSSAEVTAFCARAAALDLEPVLLTPVVTAAGLERIDRLLGGLSSPAVPAVVFNDWGVLELLRRAYPDLERRAGRLMNRGLRDPRLSTPVGWPVAEAEPVPPRSGRLRALLDRCGVVALETDAAHDDGYLGGGAEGLQRTLHLPYVFAASGRNCLVKANGESAGREGFSGSLGKGCRAPCADGPAHRENRADLEVELWRGGNTLFYEAPPSRARAHLARADRIVLHGSPQP